jgi:hypothetical protein
MSRCITKCTIRVTNRLRNCGYSSVQMMYNILKYIWKFICFKYEIISRIGWDNHAFRSLASHKVDSDNDHSASWWNGTRNFLKMPMTLRRPYPGKESKNNNIPTDYNWTLQMDNKIIIRGPATSSITLSPGWPRPPNPSLNACFASMRRFLLLNAHQSSLK